MNNKLGVWVIGLILLCSFASATLCNWGEPSIYFNFTEGKVGCNASSTNIDIMDITVGDPSYDSILGLMCDGNDALINTDTTYTSYGTNSFSMCFNMTTWNQANGHIACHYNFGDDTGNSLFLDGLPDNWGFATNIQTDWTTTNPWNYENGTTHFFCTVRNATHHSIFKDGVLNNSATESGSATPSSGINFEFCRRTISEDTYLTGSFKDFLIYPYALSAQNVTDLYEHTWDIDEQPPTINFIYPTNQETYNNYAGYINYTSDEDASFICNDSRWAIFTGSNLTNNYSFYNPNYATLTDGLYSIIINSTDNLGNSGLTYLNFTLDTTNPTILTSLDNNNTYITLNESYQINYSDNIALWGFNISIDGVLIYNITNLTGDKYIYNGTINSTPYSFGAHNLTTIVWDSHTAEELTQNWQPIKTDKTLNFDGLTVTSKDTAKNIYWEDHIDKKSFCFEYDTERTQAEFTLPNRLISIDSPLYKGWFVDPLLLRWLDFSGEDDIKKVGNKVIATSKYPKKTFCYDSVGELNSNSKTVIWYKGGRLNISAYDISNGSSILINNYSISVDGVFYGNTTSGTLNIDDLTNTTYNISINAEGYELSSSLITISKNHTEYNFSLYTSNSLTINMFDEDTLLSLNGTNVTMDFSSIYGLFTNKTEKGTFFIGNLTSAEYSIQFSAESYSSRNYIVTISNRTHSSLNIYLIPNASNTIFTTSDYDSGALLGGVLSTMYRAINGSYVVIESKSSDITGRTQFSYLEGADYRFQLTKTGYNDYVFDLTPILFESYDIKMTKTVSQEEYPDYDRVAITHYPSIFMNDRITNFTFMISSPYGELVSYGYTATYPTGKTTTVSGSNSLGGEFLNPFNITGAVFGDRVIIDYYYESSIYGIRNFSAIYPISFEGTNQTTMITNRDKTYGLGIFERLLFVTIFIFIVVGISTLIGRAVEGFAFGLLLFGLFVFIGFIPIWSILISVFVGLILISAKGGI